MKVRVVYRPDKTVSIIRPALKSRKKLKNLDDPTDVIDEPEDQWLERVFSKAMTGNLAGLPYDDVEESVIGNLPREKRNQWRGEKGKPMWVAEE